MATPAAPNIAPRIVVSLSNHERMNTIVGLPLTPFDKLIYEMSCSVKALNPVGCV